MKLFPAFIVCLICLSSPTLFAQDFFDDQQEDIFSEQDPDSEKSAEQLIDDATVLLQDSRPLDARSKLLKALAKDPKSYRAHMLLSNYYMVEVGHFRLALKHAKQALNLFYQLEGKPPFFSYLYRAQHSYLLYLLSQARLNLDDYQGALDILDEYTGYGYQDEWYHSSRAWILMKLGKIDEAISTARQGLNADAETGRILNILGILLSMKGERESAIEIFDQAIRYEFSQGSRGYPATPLNNVGEVYKEIFNEPKAQASWIKATSLPDGCEHILPALNMAMVMLDALNISGAKRTIDNFEACFAQFPLKNGEEHKALIEMIRGRIDLLSGKVADAKARFEQGLNKQQWFGRIGTSKEDLAVGLLISAAESLEVENNHLKLSKSENLATDIKKVLQTRANSIRSWWLKRRARQIMIEDLSAMEDLFIRNTDSMIEYPSLGQILKNIPTQILEAKIAKEKEIDPRNQADLYYDLYLAENYLNNGKQEKALAILNQILSVARVDYDSMLRARALILKLGILDKDTDDYLNLSQAAYKISPALLRNAGLPLPVNINVTDQKESKRILSELSGSNFLASNKNDLNFHLIVDNSKGVKLDFIEEKSGVNKSISVSADSFEGAINTLSEQVFTIKQ